MASPPNLGAGHNDATPIPYKPGQSLHIQVIENFHGPTLPEKVSAIIGRIYSVTMSPVMNINIITPSGVWRRAVLKLYDRRFGIDLRQVRGDHSPHTPTDEEEFRSFIQSGKMKPFLNELANTKKESFLPVKAAHFLDGGDDDVARFEAALWQQTNEHLECETEAYRRLQGFQGASIPRMYARIRLIAPSSETVSADANDQNIVPYLEVKGILLEQINGYNLWDLPVSSLAPQDPAAWSDIVQTAVDAADAINQHGILMEDCGPRNVMFDREFQRPFIIDLAQCTFKNELRELWEELEPDEREELFRDEFDDDGEWEWDPEAEWWARLRERENPGAIGAVMATRIRREKGVALKLQYPDYTKMIDEIRRRGRGDDIDG